MEFTELILRTRELIGKGETEDALKLLLSELTEQRGRFPDLLQTLEVIQADYFQTKNKELKDTISFQEAQREYNKTNDSLLALLGQLESGLFQKESRRSNRQRWVWLGGGTLLALLLALIAFWPQQHKSCPQWDGDEFRIMLLPISNLNDFEADPVTRLQSEINRITRRGKLDVQTRQYLEESIPGGIDDKVALRLGENCEADLVLWGEFYGSSDSLKVSTMFAWVEKGTVKETSFQSFGNITELGVPQSLQDALFSICSMIALHEGDMELARKWQQKVSKPSKLDMNVRKMLKKGK